MHDFLWIFAKLSNESFRLVFNRGAKYLKLLPKSETRIILRNYRMEKLYKKIIKTPSAKPNKITYSILLYCCLQKLTKPEKFGGNRTTITQIIKGQICLSFEPIAS